MRLLAKTAAGITGTLSVNAARCWRFDYDAAWSAFALSPALPLQQRSFEDTAHAKPVEWFFDNLLPEGRLRELIAARDRIDPRDSWGLLTQHGQDTAGAISLVPAGVRQRITSGLRPLSARTLGQKILAARRRNLPLMAAWSDIHMSLAGAQEKLGLHIDAAGKFFMPEGAAASTHIVKPENASPDFPFCPANEFFCMRVAHELGLAVPAVDLLHLPEPLYAVARFDRKAGADGTVARIHQIDLCQTLGVAASRKYESEGGIGLSDLFSVIQPAFVVQPILASRAVIQWIVFNYLIGNLDAHAKNISFLMRGSKAAVAPFYDLLCVEAYLPRQTMAMSIHGENKPGWIEGSHWDALAVQAGINPQAVRTTLSGMMEKIQTAAERVMADKRFIPVERKFLNSRVLPVIAERCQFARHALTPDKRVPVAKRARKRVVKQRAV